MNYIRTRDVYKNLSSLARGEKLDCVVRAFASAFDISYEEAHSFTKSNFNRVDGKPTFGTSVILEGIGKAFNHSIKPLGKDWCESMGVKYYVGKRLYNGFNKQTNKPKLFTTKSFIKNFPKGTFIIFVRKHAFTIKDGIVYGNKSDFTKQLKRIKNIFEINLVK